MNDIFELSKSYYWKRGPVGAVLVHGFTSSPNDLRSLGEYLAAREITVYGVRLQGHGVHHKVLEKTNRFDWYYSLKRAIENIRGNLSQLFLIGYSMGGNLSIIYTELEKEINGLVLINTPIYTKENKLIFWFIPLIKRFKKFTTKKWVKNMDHYFERRDSGSYYRIPLESAWQFYKLVQESREALGNIQVPTYIIQSKRDKNINSDSASFIYNRIKSPEKKIDLIDTDTHYLLTGYEKKHEVYDSIYQYIRKNSGINYLHI